MVSVSDALPESHLTYPIPPDFLLQQVGGPKATSKSYLAHGYSLSQQIRHMLRLAGKDLRNFTDVLDWGCGCARVLRWFREPRMTCQFHGSDISQDAIDWCKANVPFATFQRNDPLPPLIYQNETFDLIYGISVLTHLDEEFQFAWLKELRRVARPGSIVMLSTHGDFFARLLPKEDYEKLLERGFLYKKVVEQGGVDGLPEFYQTTYHSRQYVENVWTKFFRLLVYAQNAAMHQDLVVMERPKVESSSTRQRTTPYTFLDLPVGFVENPSLGARVAGDKLSISGWTFHPDGGKVCLDIWIDGETFGSCVAENPRPDVAKESPKYLSAEVSGFATAISVKNLGSGLHVLQVSDRANQAPVMSTYFFKVL